MGFFRENRGDRQRIDRNKRELIILHKSGRTMEFLEYENESLFEIGQKVSDLLTKNRLKK